MAVPRVDVGGIMGAFGRPLSRRACGWQLLAMVVVLGLTGWFNHALAAHGEFATTNPAAVPLLSLAGSPLGQLDATHERVMWADALLVVGYGTAIVLGCLIAVRVVQEPAVRSVLGYGWFAGGATLVAGLLCDLVWFIAALIHSNHGSRSTVHVMLVVCAAFAIVKFSAFVIGGVTALLGLYIGAARFVHPHKPPVAADALHPPAPLEPNDLARAGARSTVEVLRAMTVPTASDPPATVAPTEAPADRDVGDARARWVRGYEVPDMHSVIDAAADAHAQSEGRTDHPTTAMRATEESATVRPAATPDAPVMPDPAVIGICLSGGGVRAATLALGALQSAGLRSVLLKARYLVSVSGGGYTAGAMQQALTKADTRSSRDSSPGSEVLRDAATAYLPGTAEEDHVRRHSSYLASTPSQLVLAIGLLLRHLVLNLALLFAPAVVVGIGVGAFYRYIPATPIRLASASTTPRVASSSDMWQATAVAVGGTLLLAVGMWLVAQIFGSGSTLSTRTREMLLAAARQLTALAVGAFVVAVVGAAIVAYTLTIDQTTHIGSHIPLTASVGVAVSYVASLLSFMWRKRAAVARAAATAGKLRRLPSGFANMLLVVLTLLALAATWLLAVGGAANLALTESKPEGGVVIAGLIGALYLLALGFVDITAISLQPFYRRQLARTFATRRVRCAGHVLAEPYPPTEMTSLAEYGTRCKDMPEILFAASASVESGRTPVGYNRVSYVFGGDWVGGPDVGYVQTAELERLCKPQIRRDLTVQGAVAISGAAIATSVGGQNAQWYETLYTITGVRLGTWLPNPAYLASHYPKTSTGKPDEPAEPDTQTWASAGIPRIRRLGYLLRELFGLHAFVAPMVRVSDGGFYDNLGMVELFRRRCTAIYCVDASGDTPPAASTLAQTLTLAREELGVEVEWDPQPWSHLTPGSGAKIAPEDPLSKLNARLSQTGVVRARFRYPDECGVPGLRGVLVVAKAALWRDLPYPLLTYAYADAAFPHETTANQWFDDAALNAYLVLGRELGAAMTSTP